MNASPFAVASSAAFPFRGRVGLGVFELDLSSAAICSADSVHFFFLKRNKDNFVPALHQRGGITALVRVAVEVHDSPDIGSVFFFVCFMAVVRFVTVDCADFYLSLASWCVCVRVRAWACACVRACVSKV